MLAAGKLVIAYEMWWIEYLKYLCGLGDALAKDFNLDVAKRRVKRDGHCGYSKLCLKELQDFTSIAAVLPIQVVANAIR